MPWGRLFRNRTMWFLFAMYFCWAYGYYFFVTWLPTYLMEEHGLTLQRSGFYAGLPLAAGAIGCISGGTFSDWLVRRTGSMRWGRRLVGVGGFILAAVGFAGAAMVGDPLAAVLWMAVAQGSQDLTLPVAWATWVDVGGRFGGTATGFMNTASSISAMISPLAAAWLGFERIIIADGHGSNMPILELVARRTNLESDALCGAFIWPSLALKEIREVRESGRGGMAHAGELETSVYLHIASEKVQFDKAKKDINPPNSEFM